MPGKYSNFGQFWQELKRRRVIHVITVYATSAFVIIELVINLTEPLNLPARLPIIVVVVLAIGFPLVIILSWLYDLTSEGVERTKPLSEIQEGEKPAIPNAWKIATYVSFVVIIGLVALNVMGGGKKLRAGDIRSLVILPFENFTGDDQLDWFVEGMQASLIHNMGRISGFEVINRTTSNVYKNVDMQVHEIASELEVDAAIETDVMCVGDTICLQVRVISAFPEEKTLWIADYKEEKSQILNLYTRITKQIANEVRVELTADEDRLLAETHTIDPEAIDAYMRGLFYLDRINKVSLQKAKEHFNAAIEIERDWAAPYSGLAAVGAYQMQIGLVSPSTVIPMIHENLNKALELDPNSSTSHFRRAGIAVWTEWNWEKGEREFVKALELNPSNALCRMFYAHLLMCLQRSDEAIYQANQALKVDPMRPFILGLYAVVMRETGNTESAILHAKKALSIDPNHGFAKAHLMGAYQDIEDCEKWFEMWKEMACWDDEVKSSIEKVLYEKGFVAAIEELLRLNERVGNEDCQLNIWSKVHYNIQVKNYDKALDYLEKLYEIYDPNIPYLATRFYYLDLKDNSRYIKLLEKMNLPLPED